MKTTTLCLVFVSCLVLYSCTPTTAPNNVAPKPEPFDLLVKEQYSEWRGYNRYPWTNTDDNLTKAGLEILAKIDSLNFVKYQISRIPKTVLQCPNLNYLNLLGQKINWQQSVPMLKQLSPKVELYVSVHNLDSIPRLHWKQIAGVEILQQELDEIPENILKNTQLKYLYLGKYNKLPNLSDIAQLDKLEYLHAEYSQIDAVPAAICNLHNLKILQLGNNHLATLPPDIGNLTNLRELDVQQNRLTTIPPEIGKLKNLIALLLWNNQLTKLPPEIRNLTNLKILFLSNNNFSDQEKEKIQQWLPDCEIVW